MRDVRDVNDVIESLGKSEKLLPLNNYLVFSHFCFAAALPVSLSERLDRLSCNDSLAKHFWDLFFCSGMSFA